MLNIFGRPFVQVVSSSLDGLPFGHNRHGRKTGEAAVPLLEGELGPHVTHCGMGRDLAHSSPLFSAETYLRTKWHLDPSSRLGTIDGPKGGEGAVPPFWGGELGPHLAHSSPLFSAHVYCVHTVAHRSYC